MNVQFRRLHRVVGRVMGMKFDFSRMKGSANPRTMSSRAKGESASRRAGCRQLIFILR